MEEGKEMAGHCSSHVIEEKQSICMSNVSDFPLLTDEKFDFDLSLSPASGNEDEVFVGPLGHKEKCIAVNIEAKESAEKKSMPASDDKLMWSPLTGEKFVEIFKEANLLAMQIETGSKNEQTKMSQSEERENKIIEKFVEDSKSKLKILRNQNIGKSPRVVKRETYCVQDSPVCQLPPCFRKESDKLLSGDKTHAIHTHPNRSPAKNRVSPTKIASSPLTQEQETMERNTKATGKLPIANPSSTLGKSNLLTIEKVKTASGLFSLNTAFVCFKNEEASLKFTSKKLQYQQKAWQNNVLNSFVVFFFLLNKLYSLIQPGLKKITHSKLPGVASGLTRKATSSSVSSMNSSLNSSLPISPIGKNG
ncbi:GTSE1 protein, partial [Ardeotis kori]|nr:GTSE1 protein [Ardeotis kori]